MTEKHNQKTNRQTFIYAYAKNKSDLFAVQCKIQTVTLDKPLYTGFSVLDLSKLLMYDWHYNHMMKKYTDIKLLFTDTDSLCYEIKTNDIYADMEQDKQLYDFSEYPFEHPLYSTENKKVIGKMKDELNSIPLQEFIGLRPKYYSLLFEGKVKDNIFVHRNTTEKKTSKRIKKAVKETYDATKEETVTSTVQETYNSTQTTNVSSALKITGSTIDLN